MMPNNSGNGFSDLLQATEQLTALIDHNGELPRVQRNLKQILDAGQQLWLRTSQGTAQDVKASILLGSKGFDLPAISQKLESLSAAKTYESIKPIKDLDVQGFLKNERENAILSVIEETKKSTYEFIENKYWEDMEIKWEQDKQKILGALVGTGQDLLDLTLQPEPTILRENVSPISQSGLNNQEMAYAKVISDYNEQVVHGGIKPNLAQKLSDASKSFQDKTLKEIWGIVQCMLEIPLQISGNIVTSRQSVSVVNSLIKQGKNYLEEGFLKHMETSVMSSLQNTRLGGVPGTFYIVRSYVQLKIPVVLPGYEDGCVNGQPVWPMIYCCLRAGDYTAAMQVANAAGNTLADFRALLTEILNSDVRKLSPSSEAIVHLHYRRTVRTSTDPYKRLVYCMLGGCDVNDDHTEVATRTEDYIWLKLCQIRQPNMMDKSGGDRLTYNKLQSMLLEEYGENHFNAYQNPYVYFSVLFLTGQFEAAIEFLSRIPNLRCHAVHMAICLYEMNLLALPTNIQAPLLSKEPNDTSPFRKLNFARLIMMYTKRFEGSDPREALHYFYFLRSMKGIRDENLFMACVSELVLESRDFEFLLGRLDSNGSRTPGYVDKFQGDAQKIIEMVAKDSEEKGLLEDAVHLYDLAMHHDKVLQLLIKLLSQITSQVSSPDSVRTRLITQSSSVATRYKKQGHHGNRETASILYQLLDIIHFFDLYHSKKLEEALDTIGQLKIIPLTQQDLEKRVHDFRNLHEDLRRTIPDILLATINILYSKYQATKNSLQVGTPLAKSSSQNMILDSLKSQAKCLITFAGMIPYRLPSDANARLVQTEILMN